MTKSFEDFNLEEEMGIPSGIVEISDMCGQFVVDTIEKKKSLFTDIPSLTTSYIHGNSHSEFPVDKVNFVISQEGRSMDKAFKIEGAYGPNSMNINENGTISFKLIINIFYDEEFIDDSSLKAQFLQECQSIFYHEIFHAYDDYKRRQRDIINGIEFDKQVQMANIASLVISKHEEKLPNILRDFLFFIYCSAASEVNARHSQLYPFIKDVVDPRDREHIIKNSFQWNIATRLEKFDGQKFYDNLVEHIGLEATTKVIQDVGKMFVDMADQTYSKMMDEAIGKMEYMPNKMRFIMRCKSIIDHNMEQVEKLSRKTPLSFIMWWEKKFHKEARFSKLKMAKLTTI